MMIKIQCNRIDLAHGLFINLSVAKSPRQHHHFQPHKFALIFIYLPSPLRMRSNHPA